MEQKDYRTGFTEEQLLGPCPFCGTARDDSFESPTWKCGTWITRGQPNDVHRSTDCRLNFLEWRQQYVARALDRRIGVVELANGLGQIGQNFEERLAVIERAIPVALPWTQDCGDAEARAGMAEE